MSYIYSMRNNTKEYYENRIEKLLKFEHESLNFPKNCVITTSVSIVCKKHGEYKCQIRNLLKGNQCKKCFQATLKNRETKWSTHTYEQFLQFALEKHGNKYDYSLINKDNYSHKKECKLPIICKKHGVFYQNKKGHFGNKGCYKCSRIFTGLKIRNKYNIEDLKNNFNKIHNNFYDYSKVNLDNYTTKSNTKIRIICPDHGEFEQRLVSHLNGSGCLHCKFYGYRKSKYLSYCKIKNYNLILFYILLMEINNEKYIKVGITSQSIKRRYHQYKNLKYKELIIIKCEPKKAWNLEQYFKNKMGNYRYECLQKPFTNSKETFNLNLDYNKELLDLNLDNSFEFIIK